MSKAELDYFVNIDHRNHEAIVAIDPSDGMLVGVARYIRSSDHPENAEVAVVVADDWQQRELGRALLDRLADRARREGVRRFSALVQSENRASLGLLESIGTTHHRFASGLVELLITLPPKQGIGSRLSLALRTAASGRLVAAKTLAHGVPVEARGSLPPGRDRPMRPSRPRLQIADQCGMQSRALCRPRDSLPHA